MLRWLIIGGIVFVFILFWQFLFNKFVPRCFDSKWCSFWRRFLANLVIALGIVWFIILFYQKPLIMDVEDASLDFVMQISQDIRKPLPENKQVSFVFLDIDDQTYHTWGEPLFTPRNHLKSLIEAAVDGEARLVVVDVDLSQETPTQRLQLPTGYSRHPDDQKLYNYIANYKTYCQEKKACPPIILTRVFRPWAGTSNNEKQSDWTNIFRSNPLPIYEIRSSFLEKAAEKSIPYVQWGSPLFWRSSYDNVVRRWWLWQPVCENKQPGVLPSLQLSVAAMICHEAPGKAQIALEDRLSQFMPTHCSKSYNQSSIPTGSIPIVENCLTITTGIRGIQQRIRYNLPWRYPQSTEQVRDVLQDKDGNIILTIYSAQPFLKDLHDHKLAESLKNKVVLIGGSYREARDFYLTPLGEMPGGLIVINAMYSLLQGEIKPLLDLNSWWWMVTILFVLLMVLLMSIMFTIFHTFWGIIFSGFFIIVVIVPLGVWFFDKELWLSFTIPLLAVQFHHIAADFQKMTEQLDKYEKLSTFSKFLAWQSMTVGLIKTINAYHQKLMTELHQVSKENRQIAMKLQTAREQNEQVATKVKKEVIKPDLKDKELKD